MRPTSLAPWLAATLFAACALERRGLGPGPTIDASLDATADGGLDACVSTPERCNERDDDCDGRVDEDFDVSSDPQHCGGCNRACVGGANATALCVDGTCVLRCESGYLDCDERAGCESDATSPASCGSCTVMCAAPTPLCDPGSGSDARCVADCPAGTTRCGATCVATDSSPVHCGACDNRCPDPA
ncbi:MAG: hypothetical protein NZ898_17235, partial [Myxococcota bacterium]|nr:hypothetical protein [Myxococcota bacterium]